MANLRKRGFIVARVEQRLHMPKSPFPITRDCFGFGDLLIAHETEGILLVQVTSTGNMNAREKKMLEADVIQGVLKWKLAGGKVLLHGWAKRGKRGERKLWTLTEKMI